MGVPYLTISWIGLTSVIPLSILLIAVTLVSIHRKRNKCILLLSIVYAQLILSTLGFTYSTLTLLKIIQKEPYEEYLSLGFNFIVIFKSLGILSLHFEELYKIKSPSNYLLNINSSLLKYHLLVISILSLMGTYFLRNVNFIPIFNINGINEPFILYIYIGFHSLIFIISILFIGLKLGIRRKSIDLGVIGTNSTSSSANFFDLRDSVGHSGRKEGIAATGIASINLIINATLIISVFSGLWLPERSTWPIVNLIFWSQVLESVLTPVFYFWTHGQRRLRSNIGRYKNQRDSSLVFNNGEFQYFSGGKHNTNSTETVLNNANNGGMSSQYNTYDSFHQDGDYTDSLRCASVTTIANDDFEFLSRRIPLQDQFYDQPSSKNNNYSIQISNPPPPPPPAMMAASLSMNDLDLIDSSEKDIRSGQSEENTMVGIKGSKYKKNGHPIKKRFTNRSLHRRVLSLESLHSSVNESHFAYLDTGERVMIFTTDFI